MELTPLSVFWLFLLVRSCRHPHGASGLPTCRGLLLNPRAAISLWWGSLLLPGATYSPLCSFAPTLPKVTTTASRLLSHPARAGTSSPPHFHPPAHGYLTGTGPCVVGQGDSSCHRGPAPSSRPLVSQTTVHSPNEWNTSSQGEV